MYLQPNLYLLIQDPFSSFLSTQHLCHTDLSNTVQILNANLGWPFQYAFLLVYFVSKRVSQDSWPSLNPEVILGSLFFFTFLSSTYPPYHLTRSNWPSNISWVSYIFFIHTDLPDSALIVSFVVNRWLSSSLGLISVSGLVPSSMASLVARLVKNPPTVQETGARSLGREDPEEKETAIHSSIPAWKIPGTEEPGGL